MATLGLGDARRLELGDARGLEDVINKQHLTFALNLLNTNFWRSSVR